MAKVDVILHTAVVFNTFSVPKSGCTLIEWIHENGKIYEQTIDLTVVLGPLSNNSINPKIWARKVLFSEFARKWLVKKRIVPAKLVEF